MGDQAQDEALNENLGDFLDCLSAIDPNKDGTSSWKAWSEDNWEEEMEKHPLFRTKPIEPGEELSEEMEAVMAMKWDIEDPNEKGLEYKKEGNQMFQLKKYRFAIISYTEGIRLKGKSSEVSGVLYANRAAAHFRLENWRSALRDCAGARKFVPGHKKAIDRGIDCCLNLAMYGEAIKWCDAALILNSTDDNALSKRKEAEKKKRGQERDRRRADLLLKKERQRKSALICAVKERGLRLGDVSDLDADQDDVQAIDALDLSAFESKHPSGATVVVGDDGTMSWPVMFLYPEYGETDFIQSFHEAATFNSQIEVMFSSDNRPAWDADGKYNPKNLLLFYEDKKKAKLMPVPLDRTLLEVAREPTHFIYGGTPSYIVLPNNCQFLSEYLKHYERATS